MSDAVDVAIGQMADLVGNSTSFSDQPGHPETLTLAMKDRAAKATIVLSTYSAVVTKDPGLWNLVGKTVQAFNPEQIAEVSVDALNAYSQDLMDTTQRYLVHWNNYPQMEPQVTQSLAQLMLTWHSAMMLDPRHESFSAYTSNEWYAVRLLLTVRLPD